MEYFTEDIKYGLRLFPFAALIAIGIFVFGTGPTVFQSVASRIGGVLGSTAVLVLGILVLQVAGAAVAMAGFFGGMYRVIQDANE